MGGKLSAEIYYETPVTAVIFLRITGGFAKFLPPIRRYRRKNSAKFSTRVSLVQNIRQQGKNNKMKHGVLVQNNKIFAETGCFELS